MGSGGTGTKPITRSRVGAYLANAGQWREEMRMLRRIALDCGLDEELKWGKPCYTLGKHNVVILQGFKDRCAIMFFKGALLKDPKGLLEKPGANSHVARRMVFSSLSDVVEREGRLRAFIKEAIRIEKAGLKVEAKAGVEPLPDELKEAFREVPGLKKAFGRLTPGRQRGYILHFADAKQSRTRRSRIQKCVPRILDGVGLRD